MNIILAPTVHLLAEPVFHPHPRYKLPKWNTAAEALVAHAGKGCYDSYGEDGRDIEEHIHSLISSKHGSVLEHANFSLFIEGVSRGLSHEFVRHRAGFAFSQRSTRYTSEEEASIILDPYYATLWARYGADVTTAQLWEYRSENLVLGGVPEEYALLHGFLRITQQCFTEYDDQVRRLMRLNPAGLQAHNLRKWARGKARQVLPHALETRLTVTGNLRAWRHFFEQRSSRWAEPEIRRLAHAIYRTILPRVGSILKDYREELVAGLVELTTDYPKV